MPSKQQQHRKHSVRLKNEGSDFVQLAIAIKAATALKHPMWLKMSECSNCIQLAIAIKTATAPKAFMCGEGVCECSNFIQAAGAIKTATAQNRLYMWLKMSECSKFYSTSHCHQNSNSTESIYVWWRSECSNFILPAGAIKTATAQNTFCVVMEGSGQILYNQQCHQNSNNTELIMCG